MKNPYSGVKNPYAGMENVYEDTKVNLQAADYAKEQSQQNMANIMSTMSGAAGSSGVAGLAQQMANVGSQQGSMSQKPRVGAELGAEMGYPNFIHKVKVCKRL